MPQTNTRKPIGCIYIGDTIKDNDVYDNGGSLSFKYKCNITSHTDAEIIAAKKPLHITFTGYDETKTLKGMYVPVDEINTHVPAKIFLKEAHAVRDLISPFMSIPVIANNNQSITLPDAFDRPHIVMFYPFELIQKLIVNNVDHSYYGDSPTNLNPGLYQLYTFGSANNYHFSLVPLGEYFKGSDGKPYSIADKTKNLPTTSGTKMVSGKLIVQGYIEDKGKTLVIQASGPMFYNVKNAQIENAANANLISQLGLLDDVVDLLEKTPTITTHQCINGLEIVFRYMSALTTMQPATAEDFAISGTIDDFSAKVTYN